MTKPPWTADIEIDASLARRLIAAQFTALGATSVEPFGFGWDNAAFLIDERLVFRFPRRRSVAGLIEREAALLPHVAPQVSLRIPVPRYVGVAGAEYPWTFAGYELLAGTTACSRTLSDDARGALAEPLARFLRELHSVETAPLVALGLPPDGIGRLDHAKRLPATRERLRSLAGEAEVHVMADLVGWLEAHPPAPLDDGRRTLVHGDLYARHVLLDARARPCGVIDWGDMHLGDSAIDIGIAHLMLPARAHAAFRTAYGPIDERTWNAARYRAIYHAILELDYGTRAQDGRMRAIGATALRLLCG